MTDYRKDRMLRSLDARRRESGYPEVTEEQIGLVLRALADHTQIMDALRYSVSTDPDEPWPEALSIGRWMHHMADLFDPRFPPDEERP